MNNCDEYIIDLKNLKADSLEHNYRLGDKFFSALDQSEVKSGDVSVFLHVKEEIDSFLFHLEMEGTVVVPCDLCLDDMDQTITVSEDMKVKFGDLFVDDGDSLITIPEKEGTINLSWYMYEFIVLAIPMRHEHENGKCNKDFLQNLNKYSVTDKDEKETDPRWDELKKIIDNN
jgi:uncharacterized metal-binding protein YceD (DUF177 family)